MEPETFISRKSWGVCDIDNKLYLNIFWGSCAGSLTGLGLSLTTDSEDFYICHI